ncbi:MAG: hypothetical protein ACJ786_26510 [Catenulispora sp.]
MLPVTGAGIALAGHNVTLGVMIATAGALIVGGSALYRLSKRGQRVRATN